MALTARDIMTTEVITVTPSTPLKEFARICAEDKISGAPVVTVDGRLAGIVSRTDLLERLAEIRDLDPQAGEEMPGEVQDIMQERIISVPPATTLDRVAKRMAEERIHRVLVTEKGKLVGIITSLDLLGRFPAG